MGRAVHRRREGSGHEVKLPKFLRKMLGLKSSDFWTHEDALQFGTQPNSSFNWGRGLRHGLDSNVIMSPVNWIMRTFTEAEARVQSRTAGRWKWAEDHPLEMRVAQPNEFYDGDTLFKATIISYALDGNAYWLKRRNAFGEVMELWYLPHFLVEPKRPIDGSVFLSHYEYFPEGQAQTILPRDMVHIRLGLDPRNTLKGFSPLKGLLREIWTDEEAQTFSAAILRNMGVPGIVFAPKDAASSPDEEGLKETKKMLMARFTGDKRGEPIVFGAPTDIEQFGFDPNSLNLTGLRDITEERVCAMLGIPAAVVGFGAGLQQTKVGATMRELVRLARVNAINPMARTFGKALDFQLLPDFVSQTRRFRVRFDMSEVSVFQEDETEREKRILARVEGGVMQVSDAQEDLGLEVDESQKVYLRKTELQAVPANKKPPEPSPNGTPPNELDEEMETIRNRLQGVE